ncbi:SGNH/GDSL hydrolase family protein [Rhodopseudomonas sp. P2A-2r]|uniref:SGNH/GDSL hydrolase family protein n=1 Tax=Rhodopseudomonas sp. P2A-2r TaxID=2991972 RepID=UPI00223454E5|nr:SGNH/GDSL hydrolase family protein [Rhodopseudomonas sp. P2A-2r]UZE49514.1 SGNH/GDSL hydrolase family protein [Rhodopseudomonas sp. P2A-2r]
MSHDLSRMLSISLPLNRGRTALGGTAAAAIVSVVILGATILPAKAQFTAIYGFGDSYADTGAAPGGAFQLGHLNCVYSPNCTFTGSTTFVQSLQSIYGLPGMTNYAIGGARTDNTNTLAPLNPGFGFSYELVQSAGLHYASSDLIALSIGGNDLSAITLTGVAAADRQLIVLGATTSAGLAAAGVQQMAAQGTRNIAWLSTGSSKWFPAPPGSTFLTDPLRDAWANTYYQQTQQLLAPLAQSGVRIFLFNFGILQERVANNPGMYGFTSATACEAGPAQPGVPRLPASP